MQVLLTACKLQVHGSVKLLRGLARNEVTNCCVGSGMTDKGHISYSYILRMRIFWSFLASLTNKTLNFRLFVSNHVQGTQDKSHHEKKYWAGNRKHRIKVKSTMLSIASILLFSIPYINNFKWNQENY